MQLPTGKISGQQLNDVFENLLPTTWVFFMTPFQRMNRSTFIVVGEPLSGTIDELINIPGELENAEDTARFLSLSFDFLTPDQMPDPRKMAHLKEF